MVNLRKTPSVQHTVALIADTVAGTVRNFERLDAAKISITLDPGRRLFKPLMEGHSVAWAIRQCELEREKNIKPNIGLVEAFGPYAASKAVPWFREFEKHYFPIGGGVVIPVRPAGFWAEDGQLRVLWVQCWKGRTLDPLQRAIFNTIVQKTCFIGDFKDAQLEWVDLREARPGKGRDIEVLSGAALGTVSDAELAEYMNILMTAFAEYSAERNRRRAEERAAEKSKPTGPTPLGF